MCLYECVQPIVLSWVYKAISGWGILLLMPNRRIFQESPQHSKLDMVAVFYGSRLSPKRRCEDGNEANAH